MKSFQISPKKMMLSLMCLSIFGLPSVGKCWEGGREGHGGDLLVSEFTGTMANIVKAIETVNDRSRCVAPSILHDIFGGRLEIPLKELKEVRKNSDLKGLSTSEKAKLGAATVYSKPVVILNGYEQSAVNQWTKENAPEIILSRIQLLNVTDPLRYSELVLHEYYGLLDIEDTNQSENSKACIRSLTEQGVSLMTLVHREKPTTSIEERFFSNSNAIYLKCENANGQYRVTARQDRHGSFSVFVINEHEGKRSSSLGVVRFSTMTVSDILKTFRFEYSIETGLGLVVWKQTLDNGNRLQLSTVDHALWDLSIAGPRRRDTLNAKCVLAGALSL